MQGANHSHSRRYGEDLQRRRPPDSADAHGAATCSDHPKVIASGFIVCNKCHARTQSEGFSQFLLTWVVWGWVFIPGCLRVALHC